DKSGLDACAKLTVAELNKRSGDADLLKDKSASHDESHTRKLAYIDYDKESPARSLAKGFSDRFSLESSGTSDTHGQTRSTSKGQKTPFKNKEPTHLRRSRRLEDRSTTKEKARNERSKSREKRSRHQEISSDSEYEEGSKDAYEDLNSPYKRPKPTPFTQRITRFKYHRREKLPRNIRVYEENKDPEDHLGGAARNWFDDMDPKSVDNFEELSQKFLKEFSQQKRYAKDPTEIHGIKRMQNEGLQAFMDRFKSESLHIKEVPPVLRITAFMHGHGHSELAKKLNDKIPKTVDVMSKESGRSLGEKWSLGQQKWFVLPKGTEGKLAHLVKDIRRNNQQNGNQGRNGMEVINMIREEENRKRPFEEGRSSLMSELTFPAIPRSQLTDEPIILEVVIEENQVRIILVDGGSSSEIMYELCFRNLDINIRSRLRRCKAPMIGVVTMETSRETLRECKYLERVQGLWKEVQWRQREEQMSRIREQVILRTRSTSGRRSISSSVSFEKTRSKEDVEEIFTISHECPDQYVTVWATLTTNCKRLLADILRENMKSKGGKVPWPYSNRRRTKSRPERIQAITQSHTPRSPNQIRSLFLQLTAISKFIPKLAELKHPIRETRTRMETAKKSGWTNEAEEALRRIKRKLGKLQTLAIPTEGETLMLCLRQRNETISSVLLMEKEGIQIPVSHTNGGNNETLRKKGRLAKWVAEIRAYDISYTPRREVEGSLVKKFFGQGEQVEETPDANEGGTLNLRIILVSPEEKMYSYAISLKFNAFNHDMDYEALLTGLAVSVSKGMKDLHVFMDSPKLVAQKKENNTPVTKQEGSIRKKLWM
nr:reverse transcriptase domain-containing protein [Tanacetum cinerariifolium]